MNVFGKGDYDRTGAAPLSRFSFRGKGPRHVLDFLLEAPVPAPLVNGGATLVNVPDPARFALHKLILAGRRPVAEQSKAGKDRQQAAEMIAALHEDRRGDLALAAKALGKRPAVWSARLKAQLAALPMELNEARALILRNLPASVKRQN